MDSTNDVHREDGGIKRHDHIELPDSPEQTARNKDELKQRLEIYWNLQTKR